MITFVLSAMALAAPLPTFLPPPSATDGELEFAVEAIGDSLQLLPGGLVTVTGVDGVPIAKTLGLGSRTRYDPATPSDVVTIDLAPGSVPDGGETLGMTYVVELPAANPALDMDFTWKTTHPVAQEVYVEYSDQGIPDIPLEPDEFLNKWCYPEHNGGLFALGAPPDSTYAFTVGAAHLHNNRDIEAYFSYRGVDLDLSEYKVGLVLRNSALVDLGLAHPLMLEISSEHDHFASTPKADIFFFPTSAAHARVHSYGAAAWSSGKRNFVSLFGRMGEGDTVVLLKAGPPGFPGPSENILFTPPFSPVPSTGGGSGGSSTGGVFGGGGAAAPPVSAASDCTPTAPTPSFPGLCADSSNNMPQGGANCQIEMIGWLGCDTSTNPRGDKKCMSPGENWAKESRSAGKHSFQLSVVFFNGAISTGYGYEHETSKSEIGGFDCCPPVPPNPSSCATGGACYQYWDQALYCLHRWRRMKNQQVPRYVIVEYIDEHGRGHDVPMQQGFRTVECVVPMVWESGCMKSYTSSNFCCRE